MTNNLLTDRNQNRDKYLG